MRIERVRTLMRSRAAFCCAWRSSSAFMMSKGGALIVAVAARRRLTQASAVSVFGWYES